MWVTSSRSGDESRWRVYYLNKLFPIFLKLTGKKVLIVGGGLIALQKIQALLSTDAKLVVMAPVIIPEVKAQQGEFPNFRKIEFVEREYQLGDEKEFFLVIAATDIAELNEVIYYRCQDQSILVNSVDKPDNCDFYIPSVIESGDIKVAISTNGKAPSVSQRMRKDLQSMVDQRYKDLVTLIHEFRIKVQAKIEGQANFARRSKLIRWYTERMLKKRSPGF